MAISLLSVACSAPKAGLVEDLVLPPIVSGNGADFAGLDELYQGRRDPTAAPGSAAC
jgi:hypothetical protein